MRRRPKKGKLPVPVSTRRNTSDRGQASCHRSARALERLIERLQALHRTESAVESEEALALEKAEAAELVAEAWKEEEKFASDVARDRKREFEAQARVWNATEDDAWRSALAVADVGAAALAATGQVRRTRTRHVPRSLSNLTVGRYTSRYTSLSNLTVECAAQVLAGVTGALFSRKANGIGRPIRGVNEEANGKAAVGMEAEVETDETSGCAEELHAPERQRDAAKRPRDAQEQVGGEECWAEQSDAQAEPSAQPTPKGVRAYYSFIPPNRAR